MVKPIPSAGDLGERNPTGPVYTPNTLAALPQTQLPSSVIGSKQQLYQLIRGGDSECRGGYGFQIKKKKEEKDWQIKHDVVKRRMQLWEWSELLWTEEQRVEDGGGPVTAPPG